MSESKRRKPRNLLQGARVYLSGPMDFVASRDDEMANGWRARVGTFLRALGCIVFDPWQKPEVRGLHGYGREDAGTTRDREAWTFAGGAEGARARSRITGKYWETLHVDLRMVDTSDFLVACCPTNVYSVGTVHEIALARQQRKPVLLVSPSITFPAFDALAAHLEGDRKGRQLLAQLEREVPIKPNAEGIPSLWYMPLVGGESFFDGFGFAAYRERFRWKTGTLDAREKARKPARPLLPYLERIQRRLPLKWDGRRRDFVRNDDWLLWDLERIGAGAQVTTSHARRGQ